MRLGVAGADDEEIGEARNAAQIDRDDVLRFFFSRDAGDGLCE